MGWTLVHQFPAYFRWHARAVLLRVQRSKHIQQKPAVRRASESKQPLRRESPVATARENIANIHHRSEPPARLTPSSPSDAQSAKNLSAGALLPKPMLPPPSPPPLLPSLVATRRRGLHRCRPRRGKSRPRHSRPWRMLSQSAARHPPTPHAEGGPNGRPPGIARNMYSW